MIAPGVRNVIRNSHHRRMEWILMGHRYLRTLLVDSAEEQCAICALLDVWS
jgi:hypothetical protein